MQSSDKTIMRALAGETLPTPPVWMMRQAGRYLPEYRATRAQAGSFLDLCYNPDLAAEVTLQPIRRYGFDAAILFADILLLPQALGADLWFVEGEGPRLSTITDAEALKALKPVEAIHETLNPVYETVRNLKRALPSETTLIGFAGAPWTVATYMIAGQGTKEQGPARKLMYGDTATFDALMDLITEGTADYLLAQIEAGAEVVKLFDSWAGALPGGLFHKYATEPARKIIDRIHAAHPEVPVIGFPRQAGEKVIPFVERTGVAACAIDTNVDPAWAAQHLQPLTCVQGNLDPTLLITGGEALTRSVQTIASHFAEGPYIFNLGHG
ncbi:MAG: uroporphyrinogen decarboxylase, partial [Pseudomonadota bacterium]